MGFAAGFELLEGVLPVFRDVRGVGEDGVEGGLVADEFDGGFEVEGSGVEFLEGGGEEDAEFGAADFFAISDGDADAAAGFVGEDGGGGGEADGGEAETGRVGGVEGGGECKVVVDPGCAEDFKG